MQQPFDSRHVNDSNGKPAGGFSRATGIEIEWQNGPLANPQTGERQEPPGAFVETVIAIAADRIRYYQNSEFSCRENALALTKLEEALHWLQHRTADREARGVEGTHRV